MSCARWKWFFIVAVLLSHYVVPAPILAQADDKIDLEEITLRLKTWRNSFVNLRMVYDIRGISRTKTIKPLIEWSAPDVSELPAAFSKEEWIWADHGLDLLEHRSTRVPQGRRTAEVFNGPDRIAFVAKYEGQESTGQEKLEEISLHVIAGGKAKSTTERKPVRGLYWTGVGMWLPEMLLEWKWKLEAIEEINGHRCARIVATDPSMTDVDWPEIIWLDLKHDCLVRRHLSPTVPDRRIHTDYLVDDFQRSENGMWYPQKGRYQMGDTEVHDHHWEVTEFAVNLPLDIARFTPPEPAVGTILNDPKTGMVYVHGSKGVAALKEAQHRSSGVSAPPPSATATPPTSGWFWWSAGLVCVSVLLLVVGYRLSQGTKENRS